MNTLTRLVAGFVTAAVAVLLLFFLTTVGLIIAAVVGVVLFVGALSLRGKGNDMKVGGFRVITFGSQPFDSQSFREQPFREQPGGEGTSPRRPQKAIEDVVDLSPEDYRPVDSPTDNPGDSPEDRQPPKKS